LRLALMDLLEPKNKRERKKWNYHRVGATGRLPWSARGIEECVRHVHRRLSELTQEERKGWDPTIESLFFIKRKYGESKGSAHFLRMGQIINFMQHYRERLKKDKLIFADSRGRESWEDNLVEAFAKLPFTIKSFRYDDVKRYVQSCKKPS